MADDTNARMLYQIHKTLMEMLSDRGYMVADKEKNYTYEDFTNKYGINPVRRDLFGVWVHRTDPTNKILLFLPEEAKLSTTTLVEYAKQMKSEKIQRCIVVYKDKITPFSKQYVAKAQQFYDFELFKDSELLVNITKHHLVPKHDLLTQDEKKELLDKYRLNESQLPRIQREDPVARYYGLGRGDVVKITRPSETAGRYITYRIVWS
eukprot:TRINITY_DN14024_c0_g1_i1.p1 TRINITY_DN14024_c0_g1~~TRINITY_DN14024_c0_g1_i1.p1  ORF type:complete len:219 (+),score=54.68 TRINITY_DN14024_c0_g1_i1:37-657(+)